jgi:hypothetical protein
MTKQTPKAMKCIITDLLKECSLPGKPAQHLRPSGSNMPELYRLTGKSAEEIFLFLPLARLEPLHGGTALQRTRQAS